MHKRHKNNLRKFLRTILKNIKTIVNPLSHVTSQQTIIINKTFVKAVIKFLLGSYCLSVQDRVFKKNWKSEVCDEEEGFDYDGLLFGGYICRGAFCICG